MSEQPSSERHNAHSIREVSERLRLIIEDANTDDNFWMAGIVKDTYISQPGHTYFRLVQDSYSIACMLPTHKRRAINFTFSDNIKVEICGKLTLYELKCQPEFQIEQARLIQQHSIPANVEERLKQKGLAPKTPKPLPSTINRIAVITSKQSKVLNDFEHTFYAHSQKKNVIKVDDVPLEGNQAERAIADAIQRINKNKEADVIVLIRGGGSESALSPFNSQRVAEAIYQSNIHVVTGIGHQSDTTDADLVADHSAITPTAAASYLAKAASPQETMVNFPASQQQTSMQRYLLLAIGIIFALAALIFAISQLN